MGKFKWVLVAVVVLAFGCSSSPSIPEMGEWVAQQQELEGRVETVIEAQGDVENRVSNLSLQIQQSHQEQAGIKQSMGVVQEAVNNVTRISYDVSNNQKEIQQSSQRRLVGAVMAAAILGFIFPAPSKRVRLVLLGLLVVVVIGTVV